MIRRISSAALLGLAALATTTQAPAQTAANGPYYATPSWDQTMPTATRFVVLANFANAAVLDRETGLVWQQTPSPDLVKFDAAYYQCASRFIGGRAGWRLPSMAELSSLFDVSGPATNPPVGPPFTLPTRNTYDSTFFWTSTEFFGTRFIAGPGYSPSVAIGQSLQNFANARAWCVRAPGDMGVASGA